MVNKYMGLNGIKNNILLVQRVSIMCGLALSVSKTSATSFDINEDWKFETNTSLSLGGVGVHKHHRHHYCSNQMPI